MGIETLAIASLAGSVISGGIGAIGAQQQASASAASSQYQAQVARNNAIIAANNAQYSTEAGATRAQAQDFKNRTVMGQIEASQGASGIDYDSPTSDRVRRSAANLGRYDTETLYNNALLQANAGLAQSTSQTAQAGLDEFAAKNARVAGTIGSFGSILGNAFSFSDKWLRYQDRGIIGGSVF